MQKLAIRKLLRDCRDGLRLAAARSIAEINHVSLIARIEDVLDATRRPGLTKPATRVIPLDGHEAIIAALQLCDLLGDDNVAVVMVKGYGEDFDAFTGIYLSDYELDDILADESWFSDYEDPQLWMSTETRGT